jgi:hypothetical protein
MEVKGTALVPVPAFIKSTFHEAGLEQWLAALSPDARQLYANPFMINHWYDCSTFITQPTLTFCDLFYSGSTRGAYEMGRFSADFALKGIYKLFVRMGSPKFILEKGTSILPTYYRPSKIAVPVIEKGRAVVRITLFPEMHAVIEQRIAGWIDRALEISGGKNVQVEVTASLLKKQAYTELSAAWIE